jgi:hypothetical protein
MATRSYREGKKMYWDRKNEQILDHPLASIPESATHRRSGPLIS